MGKGKRLKDDRTKAAKLLAVGEMLKPGKGIVWTVYNGGDVLDAEAVHNHVKAFLMSGELMPIPGHRIKLNVISVEKEYDDYTHNHKVAVEGICEKEKK